MFSNAIGTPVRIILLKKNDFNLCCISTAFTGGFVSTIVLQCRLILYPEYSLLNDSTAGAWPMPVKFTLPGHLFSHLGFPECPCCHECNIYSRLCRDYGQMIFD